jgi:serine protease
MKYAIKRRPLLRMAQLPLALLALSGSTAGLAAGAHDADADKVSAQLIVLFDPTSAASPLPEDLIASVNAQAPRETGRRASLGAPVHAEKSLRTAPPLAAAEASAAPLAPRALLDRYITLTYATPAQAAFAKAMLDADPQVLSVETNQSYRRSAEPGDAFFKPAPGSPHERYQWGMYALNFPAAWDKERGFAYIAAVDTGIAMQPDGTIHPDLQQNYRVQFSRNFRPTGLPHDLGDSIGHGSHVAGIMAATPHIGPFKHFSGNPPGLDLSSGVAGACWSCSLSVLAANPMLPEAADAIRYAADHGIQVINMSWGDAVPPPPPPESPPALAPQVDCAATTHLLMCQALAYAAARGVVMVGASGNHNQNRVQFPASHPAVIAVAGIEYTNTPSPGGGTFRGKFWNLGYGQGPACSAGQQGDECGSNYGPEVHVVAPAEDIYSTIGLNHFFTGVNMNDALHCGDHYPYLSGMPGTGTPGAVDYYGTCTGTSMAAPHISGLAGLIRSANPLADPFWVRVWLSSYTSGCENWDLKCGTGIPNATLSVQAALGHANAVNRATPLFAFYSNTAEDHFYTTIPQMAVAALRNGMLLPQPIALEKKSAYGSIGVSIPGYDEFPTDCAFSPCPSYDPPKAIANIMTSHVSPVDGSDLTPLYRYSFACLNEIDLPPASGPCHHNPRHISHVYATNPAYASQYLPTEHAYWTSVDYKLDGIEGYVFPKDKEQPLGTVKLCRKYDAARDDYVLFVSGTDKLPCSASTDGYTGGNYQPIESTSWIGYVYPPGDPQPLCPAGQSCT